MTKLKRKYSQKTLKILYGFSNNQCAHPDCICPVIEPATDKSDDHVITQICHIYALNVDGPRGKSGLTEKELNAPENLILLCPNHHTVVDGQHESYPADMLKQWKEEHESKNKKRLSPGLGSVHYEMRPYHNFPTALVDKKIEDEVNTLRKSRFFTECDHVLSSLELARRIVEGELAGGTDAVTSRALAWCARLLCPTDKLDKAVEYLELAKGFGSSPEIEVTSAFIASYNGDKDAALTALAGINSPMSRSAALMVVANHDGSQGAVEWVHATGIDATDLDPDGKFILIAHHIKLARWEAARETLDALSDHDLREAPALQHMIAITQLLSTVPDEFRSLLLNQLPFEAASFPLASGADEIETRKMARQCFIDAAEIARQLNCPRQAAVDDEYALWLELMDPDESENGKRRLEDKFRDPHSALRLVHLGIQFGIKLDLEAIEREIERQIVLNGGITQDAAIARLALAFTQKTPEDVANYIAKHFDDLTKHLEKRSIQFLQIEMLSQAGLPERANDYLNVLMNEGLSELEESRLRTVIAEAEGTDPVEARKKQFRNTDSLGDLEVLVRELEAKYEWESLCEYGETLFERTHSIRDAERLANALSNAQKSERLVEFLQSNSELLLQSKSLQLLYCWSLYHEGALLEARSELTKLDDVSDNPNYRALKVHLGIALGDWDSLVSFVANEFVDKDKRNAQELIVVAQLALQIGSPHDKELIMAAAKSGDDDAGVLAAAYFLASRAGWEDEPEVNKWLEKAAALSGDEGPIQQMSLQDLLARKPEWEHRESETWQLLSRGDIPTFLAAQSLNKSLINLMLYPSLANLLERDPRRRGIISAYSGNRQPTTLDTGGAVGIDATALLTLSFLNLLDKALDAFDSVHIPHSTLTWLFDEKQKATFHQPSRIRDARQIRDLLSTGALEEFSPSTVPNSDLSSQVGEELSSLIAEAEKARGEDEAQHIVVRVSPVYRIASLMEEEADLISHTAVLSSCQSIVDKLRQKGQLTAKEEKKAIAYLQLHEKPWPNQPEITDGAILYLDHLTITYFLQIGILEKLQAAGFRSIAAPSVASETNEFISYERISSKVSGAIESIRAVVNSRIESGKIALGKRTNTDPEAEPSVSEHPTVGVIALARLCDAIIADDRFLNQHASIDEGPAKAPIFTTLDLLDVLVANDHISTEERSEYRTLLRRAGYVFIPVDYDELLLHIETSTVNEDRVVETAELKAIRENILCVRMSTWLQLPKEAHWLDALQKTFVRVLQSLWKIDVDFSSIRARSDWILDQIDVRGWAHSLGGENGDILVNVGRRAYIMMLLLPPTESSPEVRAEYWCWIEDRILAPIKDQYPDLYSSIVESYRRQVAEMADMDLTEEETK